MAKAKVVITWNGAYHLAELEKVIARGVLAAATDIARSAHSRAPVGEDQLGKPERIFQHGDRINPNLSMRELGRRAAKLSDEQLQGFREEFLFHKGRGKDPAPDRLVVHRGFLRGQRLKKHLKDTIEVVGPTKDGHAVTASVVVRAPYAAAKEFGFHHKGGRKHSGKSTQIPAKPYLRPSIAEHAEPFRQGKYFIKG